MKVKWRTLFFKTDSALLASNSWKVPKLMSTVPMYLFMSYLKLGQKSKFHYHDFCLRFILCLMYSNITPFSEQLQLVSFNFYRSYIWAFMAIFNRTEFVSSLSILLLWQFSAWQDSKIITCISIFPILWRRR